MRDSLAAHTNQELWLAPDTHCNSSFITWLDKHTSVLCSWLSDWSRCCRAGECSDWSRFMSIRRI